MPARDYRAMARGLARYCDAASKLVTSYPAASGKAGQSADSGR
jgi:hypothetical protein